MNNISFRDPRGTDVDQAGVDRGIGNNGFHLAGDVVEAVAGSVEMWMVCCMVNNTSVSRINS